MFILGGERFGFVLSVTCVWVRRQGRFTYTEIDLLRCIPVRLHMFSCLFGATGVSKKIITGFFIFNRIIAVLISLANLSFPLSMGL